MDLWDWLAVCFSLATAGFVLLGGFLGLAFSFSSVLGAITMWVACLLLLAASIVTFPHLRRAIDTRFGIPFSRPIAAGVALGLTVFSIVVFSSGVAIGVMTASPAADSTTATATDRAAISTTHNPATSDQPTQDRPTTSQPTTMVTAPSSPPTPTAPPPTTSPETPTLTTSQTVASSTTSTVETSTTSTPSTQTSTTTSTTTSTSTTTTTTSTETGLEVTVTDVVDGDTVDIEYANGTTDTVRLLGVDTPETFGSTSPDEFEGVPDSDAGHNCLSTEADDASDYTTQELDGETVTLQFDNQSDRRGTYDRLLAYIIVDGENFNYRLVANGYARVYDSTFSQSTRFYDAESDAQSSELGVWRCRNVTDSTTTTTTTASGGDLAVETVHADASGNDHENLNDEYVVFTNDGDSTLDMGGWQVEDEADHSYTFPDDTTLEPGDSLTLYTGSGTDSSGNRYWGSESAIWNNGGDTVFVYDDEGSLRVEHSYS